ncbi:MAG: ADP-ribosylglycohydrolase family protein [Roseiflexaceae bacterium]
MMLPPDYIERVYAGVLGKIIGVYLGRPFESWTYERIMAELGEINYYVHEQRGMPLIVADDDITGTFTFLRALPDNGNSRALTPAQIGDNWLNYIVEERAILWWGGIGNSTEHTAYLHLKNGIKAPESGSMARNTKVVAEQIGSQIFIDGWAMVAPGDPELAVDLARRAASVSHDGEAIYGAQVIAAMEAQAFVERDLNALIDVALRFIPADSTIARLIHDVRNWHARYSDWHDTRSEIVHLYGYDRYGGNCHMVPNHALIHMGLLYGGDDFQKAMMITNTAGWDTDCNAANVGCLLGIKNGLATFDTGPDLRGPVADRLYLPTADGGRTITDAMTETYHVVNIARALNNLPAVTPKDGARYHFSLPGAVQGFVCDDTPQSRGVAMLTQVMGYNGGASPALAIKYQRLALGRSAVATTMTFIPPDGIETKSSYQILASPTLYSGQTVTTTLVADQANQQAVDVTLFVRVYGVDDVIESIEAPPVSLGAGATHQLEWRVPDTQGAPIMAIGVRIDSAVRADGTVYLDRLDWSGTPTLDLTRPEHAGRLWRRAWVDAVDILDPQWPEMLRLAHNRGTGMISIGTADWSDYTATATIIPHMFASGGLAVHVQGLRRYYALQCVAGGLLQLIKQHDDDTTILAQIPFEWQQATSYELQVSIVAGQITAQVAGQILHAFDTTWRHGGVGLVCTEGRFACERVTIQP